MPRDIRCADVHLQFFLIWNKSTVWQSEEIHWRALEQKNRFPCTNSRLNRHRWLEKPLFSATGKGFLTSDQFIKISDYLTESFDCIACQSSSNEILRMSHPFLSVPHSWILKIIMQFFRRFATIRSSFRCLSSSFVNVHPSTRRHELDEINKLMKKYNSTQVPIRTLALFEWMVNITNIQPDLVSYLHIIHACTALSNLNAARKVHQWIDNDRALSAKDYRHLQVKLTYLYAKTKHLC